MPKMKTKRAAAKRFKPRASGSIKRAHKADNRHRKTCRKDAKTAADGKSCHITEKIDLYKHQKRNEQAVDTLSTRQELQH